MTKKERAEWMGRLDKRLELLVKQIEDGVVASIIAEQFTLILDCYDALGVDFFPSTRERFAKHGVPRYLRN